MGKDRRSTSGLQVCTYTFVKLLIEHSVSSILGCVPKKIDVLKSEGVGIPLRMNSESAPTAAAALVSAIIFMN